MKITEYLTSSVVRLIKRDHPESNRRYYVGDFVDGIKKRYKFLQYPSRIEDFNLEKGVEFVHGIFDGDKIIGRFQVYNSGIYCEAQLPTQDIVSFIDDAFDWVRRDFGMEVTYEDPPNSLYVSRIEVKSDMNLSNALDKISAFTQSLNKVLESYGHIFPDYKATILGFSYDEAFDGIKPEKFIFERRAGKPFDSGLYFSVAPVTSSDHILLLERLEETLRS